MMLMYAQNLVGWTTNPRWQCKHVQRCLQSNLEHVINALIGRGRESSRSNWQGWHIRVLETSHRPCLAFLKRTKQESGNERQHLFCKLILPSPDELAKWVEQGQLSKSSARTHLSNAFAIYFRIFSNDW